MHTSDPVCIVLNFKTRKFSDKPQHDRVCFYIIQFKTSWITRKKTESFSTWNRLKSLNFGHPMAFGMISELMDQYIELFPIFDLFDNIFSFYPTVPYIRLHNRLIFKNHSLICRFLCIQNVLSNSIQHFECVFFSSIYLYSKKWIDNLEWCRFLFWFIHGKKTKCMYNKKGKPLIDIENLQQTEFETHLMIIGYSRE